MQAYPEGSCLRYPEPIPPQREITYEAALMMLLKAAGTAQSVPFTWGFVDKPTGAEYRTFKTHSFSYAFF
jgi:hypothetical protein